MTKSKKSSLTPHRVLAIDPGIDRVGIAVISRDNLIYSECFETNRKDTHEVRLEEVGERVKEVIKKWKPSSLALETLFFNKNITSAMRVAEARGVIIYEATRARLKLYEYSPQSVKIAVTGHGKADKTQVATMVKRLIKLPATSKTRIDDEIDAIALGITCLATERGI